MLPCHHQRLVDPGICDDLLDDEPVFKIHRIYSNYNFVLRGDLILPVSTVKLKIQTELLRNFQLIALCLHACLCTRLISLCNNNNIITIGKLISVNVKKLDGLAGFLMVYLEYFNTVKQIKDEIYLDKNMKVPPSQQQLFLNDQLLDDNLTLSQCGMENGSQVAVRGTLCTLIIYHFKNLYLFNR